MPFFDNARDINIVNATFNDIEGAGPTTLRLDEVLNQRVAWSALHNSSERCDPPRCHPETRTAVLNSIDQWTTGQREPVFWLNGAAGAGKSAIVQTTADRLQERGILGASFFFRRDMPSLNSGDLFIPTIAYQLHTSFPALRSHLFSALSRDPNVFQKSFKHQFNYLIAEPVIAAQDVLPLIIIVIDGLDECSGRLPNENETQQRLILEAIEFICRRSHLLPIRFLISSRREAQIRICFENTSLREIACEFTLKHEPESEADISLFLRDKFAEIRQRNPHIDPSWPPEHLILQIIQNSSGHFMYSSTIIRHLLSPRVNPEESLNEILMVTGRTTPAERPLAAIDMLYKQILESVAPRSLPMVISILQLLLDVGGGLMRSHSIMTHHAPHYLHSIECIAKIFSSTTSDIYATLVDLHSILDIPQYPSSAPIQFIHASLRDFLLDRERSGPFYMGGRLGLCLQNSLLQYTDKIFWKCDLDHMGSIYFWHMHCSVGIAFYWN